MTMNGMAPLTEESLIAAAKDGDSEAVGELLRRHGPLVEQSLRISEQWRTALEPSDVMQVTYLEAFLEVGSFDPNRGTFRSWLQRIAENNLRDAIRGLERAKRPQPQDRIRPTSRDESMMGLIDQLGAISTTPSRAVRRDEALRLLDAAIVALPETYADVIRWYDLEGRTIEDVAQTLGRSAGAVHMLRARAHDRLREQLGSSPGAL